MMAVHGMLEKLESESEGSDYGKGIKLIVFMPMAVSDELIYHPEHKKYRPRAKRLELSLKLDYDRFAAADEREAVRMTAELFYNAIDEYEALGVKDFDTDRFRKDIRDFFIKNGYLDEAFFLQPAG